MTKLDVDFLLADRESIHCMIEDLYRRIEALEKKSFGYSTVK